MIELERTFLARRLPDLSGCKRKEILDRYIPAIADHPTLRVRKTGERFELTKKEPVADDPSHQCEHTIPLREDEFKALLQIPGKEVKKVRYYYPYQGRSFEIDVFEDALLGLVLIDIEFETLEEKDAFIMPGFCLVEVTLEAFIAGGMLCGKSYADIEKDLARFSYKKLP